MTFFRRHPLVTASFGLVAAISAKPMGFLYTYYHNLHPKLVFECNLDYAKVCCPEVVDWTLGRNPWERVPPRIINKMYVEPVPDTKILIATYESKIVRFVPYTFHAVKGIIQTEHGTPNTFYVYVWDKRYAPMVLEP